MTPVNLLDTLFDTVECSWTYYPEWRGYTCPHGLIVHENVLGRAVTPVVLGQLADLHARQVAEGPG